MIAAAPVIALILSYLQCYGETRDEARLTMIAESIAEVSSTREDAAALASIGEAESSYCVSVHSGRRKGGKGGGLWQLEPGSKRLPPFIGTDRASTVHAAAEALTLWHLTSNCRTLAAHFGAYAGLGCRSWSGAAFRSVLYVQAVGFLRQYSLVGSQCGSRADPQCRIADLGQGSPVAHSRKRNALRETSRGFLTYTLAVDRTV